MVNLLGGRHRERFCSADVTSQAIGRTVPGCLCFERKEHRQKTECDRERSTPERQGIGEPT